MNPELFLMFPTPILKFRLDKHQEHKETYVPKLLELFNSRTGNPSHFEHRQENSYLLMYDDSHLEILDKELDRTCVDYLNYLSGDNYAGYRRKSWFGVHAPNMHIQSHTHSGAVFSGVYYLQFNPEYDYPTTFTSPIEKEIENWDGGRFETHNSQLLQATFPNHLDIKEGDVVLFPAWLSHYVPCSKPGGQERITFVFNTYLPDETSIR